MRRTFLCCLLLFTTCIAWSQQRELLQPKRKISRKIDPGQKHSYDVSLKANQFCFLIVNQDGIDLLIKTQDPAGKQIDQFDSPNGTKGPENVTIVSSKPGTYIVEVLPLDEKADGGNYTIEVVKIEAVATTPEKEIEQLLTTMITPGGPGASIVVAKGDKILFSKGYGSANPEYDIPNTPQTVFHIASISKQFTAYAIATLADQGKLSLDDDIRKYLPELNDFGKPISIRHLIHHTSGLRDQWNLLTMAGWRMDDVITKNHVLQLMSKQKDLNFNPGDEFSYCNTGYTFMAEIVTRVTGKSLAEWSDENIFKPLGMTKTLFYDDHEKIVKNRAYSFQDSQDGLKKSVLNYANAGATSLFTTTEDLVKWSNNFQTMKIGNKNIMSLMNQRGILNKGDTLSYAFGQGIGDYKGLKTISHGGADAGYRSFLLRFPEQNYTIAVLSNLASFNTARVAYKLADIYLKGSLKEPAPAIEEPVANNESITVSEELLRSYSGQYQLTPSLVVTMRVENSKLVAEATGQPSFVMVPKTETEFQIASIGANITFLRNGDNKVNEFVLVQGGQTLKAARIKEFDASTLKLEEYAGVYYSEELETSYSFVVAGDKLVAKHIRHEPIEFKPLSANSFTGAMWFMSQVEFVRNDKGVVTGLKASSHPRVRNVRFEKIK